MCLTQHTASLKLFQHGKDGHGVWIAMMNQYAGDDKWEDKIKKQEQLIHTKQWQSNFSLESFVSRHHNAYVSMQACAKHIQYQLQNDHLRVGFLLEAIQCLDHGLQVAMANTKTKNGPNGMHNNFEDAAAHLVPLTENAKTHQLGGFEGGDKPVLIVLLSSEISIKQQQKINLKKLKIINNQPKLGLK